jgi:hypothetical protein
MNADYNARSNYLEDRSTNFKHQIPGDLAPLSAPTVEDYVYNEKSRQMSRMRDWYLESKTSSTDVIALRNKFSNLRNLSVESPAAAIECHRPFLVGGAFLAALIGVAFFFLHF